MKQYKKISDHHTYLRQKDEDNTQEIESFLRYQKQVLAYQELIHNSIQVPAESEVRDIEEQSQDIQTAETPAEDDDSGKKDCLADQAQEGAEGLEERTKAAGERKENLKSQAKRRQALVKAIQVSFPKLFVSFKDCFLQDPAS